MASYPPYELLTMPALSPTMEQGVIVSWDIPEGQEINAGDVLAQVETDKATVAFESVEDGFMAKILVDAGPGDIAVGVPVAVMCEEQADVAAFANFSLNASTPAAAAPEPAPEPVAAPASTPSVSYPTHEVLMMPALSPTMEQGTIVSWDLKEGDAVTEGAVLAQIETDKATVAFESVEAGYLAKILMAPGSTDVPVNSAVAILVEEEADIAAFANYTTESAAAAAAPAATPVAAPASSSPTPVASTTAPARDGERVFASPLARKVATKQGVDISLVTGTGPSQRVLAADVAEYTPVTVVATPAPPVAAKTSATKTSATKAEVTHAAPQGPYEDIPISNIRKVIAARLTQSKQEIPHFYVTTEINMDKLMTLRAELNGVSDVRYSVNDFLIKASALALKKHPECNSSWMDTFIRSPDYVDISVAVATPNGLITPIITDVDVKGMNAIATEGKDLYSRARDGKLQPHEFQGGTFTISNLGGMGVKEFSAIINPPQACILAVGGIDTRVVPTGEEETPFATAKILTVTMSCDHRVVDGAVGAQYLQTLKALLENPITMIL